MEDREKEDWKQAIREQEDSKQEDRLHWKVGYAGRQVSQEGRLRRKAG